MKLFPPRANLAEKSSWHLIPDIKNYIKSADPSLGKSGVICIAFSRSAEKWVNPAEDSRRYQHGQIAGGGRFSEPHLAPT